MCGQLAVCPSQCQQGIDTGNRIDLARLQHAHRFRLGTGRHHRQRQTSLQNGQLDEALGGRAIDGCHSLARQIGKAPGSQIRFGQDASLGNVDRIGEIGQLLTGDRIGGRPAFQLGHTRLDGQETAVGTGNNRYHRQRLADASLDLLDDAQTDIPTVADRPVLPGQRV